MRIRTIAVALALGSAPCVPAARAAEQPPSVLAPVPDLRAMLMGTFDALNAASEGIFRHDVTASLSPYFPVGQPIAETRRILARQEMGSLQPFKGTNDPDMGTMYVTKFPLKTQMFSHVYVVVDFDFDGTGEGDMTLKQMKAFLRASNM